MADTGTKVAYPTDPAPPGSVAVDGVLKPLAIPDVLAQIAAERAGIAALEVEVARGDEALAAGPAAVAEARALEGRVAGARAELAQSAQRTAEAEARAAAGRERLARLKGRAS